MGNTSYVHFVEYHVTLMFHVRLCESMDILRYRLLATGVYLFFMAFTLFLAFYPGEIFLRVLWLVLSIFCQFLALVWYTLSYIPFAREVMQGICRESCFKSCCATQVRRNERRGVGVLM